MNSFKILTLQSFEINKNIIMQKLLLLGDEAIAQGAIDAGISGIFAYPGTPSTEITEYVQASKEAKERNIISAWSSNEKTAFETALGMSYAGKKAMVCMKHVGLNVAADAFMNSAITGTNGGLVVVSADDPSMHSSQNEQDSRFYGKFAMIPVMEPSNQQEAYDMTRYAFELSEKYNTPVMMRVTTRLAHSRSIVIRKDMLPQNPISLPSDIKQFILLPSIARKQYKTLLTKQSAFEDDAKHSGYNRYFKGNDKSLGIIACGIAYNYLMENYKNNELPYTVLKISQYPVPKSIIQDIYNASDELLILEEGYPIIEELIRGYLDEGKTIKGKMDNTVPRAGELNPNIVGKALGLKIKEGYAIPDVLKSRPPLLCDGCPHYDSFEALNEAIEKYGNRRVLSDIGCYTLSALPPLNSINSCVDMGASITMAIGAAEAGLVPAVAAIGDSTFTHSGMTGLLDAVNRKVPITVFLLDNSTTGMTGGQDSAGFGRLDNIVAGLGVEKEHIRVIKPLRRLHEPNVEVIKQELEYKGVSVIIARRECVQTLARRMKLKHLQKKVKTESVNN